MDWEVFSVVVAIVGVGVALAVPGYSMRADNRGFLKSMQEENRRAHERIEGNIGRVEGKVDDGFSAVNSDVKGLLQAVGRLEGAQRTPGRPSETRQD